MEYLRIWKLRDGNPNYNEIWNISCQIFRKVTQNHFSTYKIYIGKSQSVYIYFHCQIVDLEKWNHINKSQKNEIIFLITHFSTYKIIFLMKLDPYLSRVFLAPFTLSRVFNSSSFTVIRLQILSCKFFFKILEFYCMFWNL